MAEPKPDFNVIYNRAMSSRSVTEDCELSLSFTEYLVTTLESKGHKGHYADRDTIPGSNIFTELFRNTRETRKTFLVVTPGFLSDCWSRYASMASFKELIDTDKCDKLIPIGIDISEHQKLPELNINNWIHFSKDWSHDNNSLKWESIIKALWHDGPFTLEPRNLHDQEHGDDRLRTERKELVVQPNSLQDQTTDFFTEKLLLDLAENFLSDWAILAIRLDLRDDIIQEVRLNNQNNVRMQAYNALLRWKKSYRGKQENRINDLLSALMKMGRKDVAENIEAHHNEFLRQYKNPKEGVDEVEMEMSRSRGADLYVRKKQTPTKSDKKEKEINERGDNTGESRRNETYMTRELKAESAAFIELNPRPDSQMSSLDSLELECGPSMSLPTARVVSLPPSKLPMKIPDSTVSTKQTDNPDKREKEVNEMTSRDVLNKETHSNTSGDKALDSVPVEEEISASRTSNLNQKVLKLDTHVAKQPPSDGNVNSKYASQQSLSRDSDLTADAQGTYSFTPNSLLHPGNGDRVDNSKQIFHNADGTKHKAEATPASGNNGPGPQKSLDEQIIQKGGNQSQELGNSNSSAADTTKATVSTPDSGYSSSVSQTPVTEQIILCEGNQPQENNITTVNSTGNVAGTNRGSSGLNVDSDELDKQVVPDSGQSSSVDNPSTGQQQNLGLRVFNLCVNTLIRPELAYS